MTTGGILATSIWPEVQPYVRIESYVKDGGSVAKARFRIELKTMPAALTARVLRTTMPCVTCGLKMHPFRQRHGTTKRTSPPHAHLYYAACCPLSVSVGCSRSAAATEEYARVRGAV